MADAILASSGIYAIRNKVNGKVYVGSAQCIRLRLNRHRSDLKTGRHHNTILLNAWRKYGAEGFTFEVLEHVADLDNLMCREQAWIDKFNSAERTYGYNILPAAGSNRGFTPSEETRLKLSALLKGRPRDPELMKRIADANRGKKRTAEYGLKISAINSGRKHTEQSRANMKAGRDLAGRAQTEATKKKLSDQRIGIPFSDARRARISEVQRGVKKSPESVEARAKAMRGRKLSDEHVAKMRARRLTDEQKAHLSRAHTGKKMSDEARLKMSISAKNRRRPADGSNS
jgi:group I intron endonuclease